MWNVFSESSAERSVIPFIQRRRTQRVFSLETFSYTAHSLHKAP